MCWVITEGIAGTENQCIAIAESLGIIPKIKRIQLRQPWKLLSPYLGFAGARSFEPPLSPPWPDLLIAGGRKSIATSLYIKKASGGKTFTVQVQDPRISPRNFDLVVAPEHDPVRGDNVFVTVAAPNRITPEKLESARAEFAFLGDLPGPRIAVLIGGTSKAYAFTPQTAKDLGQKLARLEGSTMMTASRRTGKDNEKILTESISHKQAFIWDGSGENPYFGLLAWADYILVTADSVSMLSDAASTGKPVYIIGLDGGAKRIDSLHKNLMERGIAQVFDGDLQSWHYQPLQDAKNAAAEILRRFAAKG
jgi:mitochondrial fission protein ELM1